MAFAPNIHTIPTLSMDGSTIKGAYQGAIGRTIRPIQLPTQGVLFRAFDPNMERVLTLNGLRQTVTMINAALYGRRWIPSPFANALLTLFTGSDVDLPEGYVGLEYDIDWHFTSDPTVSLFSGTMPPGLTFTAISLYEWTITGIPTLAGDYTFQLAVTAAATTGYITLHITILGRPPVWGEFDMSPGVKGFEYDSEWFIENVTFPCTYEVQVGNLPPGLELTNSGNSNGTISGTPTAVGTYNFTLRATNTDGVADKIFSITIVKPKQGGTAYVGGN